MPITLDDERIVRRIAREIAGEVFDARLPDVERTIVTAVGARFNEALAPLKQQSVDVAQMKTTMAEVQTTVGAFKAQNEKQTELFIQLAEAKGRLAQIDKADTREFEVTKLDVEVTKVAVTSAVSKRTALLALIGVIATALASLITASLMSSRPH